MRVYEGAVKRLVADFQQSPFRYFSECELQYDLYCIFKSSELNKSATTNDGVDIGTIHPEYPSVERVQLENGKGYRVWFDLAILNPDFIQSNDYKTVWARDERNAKLGDNNVLAAFEFKYFPIKRTYDFSSVQQDCIKLSLCSEITNRYVLVFSNYDIEASSLKNINLGSSSLFWVTPLECYIIKPNTK